MARVPRSGMRSSLASGRMEQSEGIVRKSGFTVPLSKPEEGRMKIRLRFALVLPGTLAAVRSAVLNGWRGID